MYSDNGKSKCKGPEVGVHQRGRMFEERERPLMLERKDEGVKSRGKREPGARSYRTL